MELEGLKEVINQQRACGRRSLAATPVEYRQLCRSQSGSTAVHCGGPAQATRSMERLRLIKPQHFSQHATGAGGGASFSSRSNQSAGD